MNKNQFEGAYTDRFFIALARVPKESVGAAQFFLRLPATNSPSKTDVLSIALLLNDNTNFQYISWLFPRNAGPGAYLYLICNTKGHIEAKESLSNHNVKSQSLLISHVILYLKMTGGK